MKMKNLLKLEKHYFQFFYLLPNPLSVSFSSLPQQLSAPFSSSSSCREIPNTTNSKLTLTEQDLTKINLLIPRLCFSNNLTTAVHLTTTALFTNPPPHSLSLSILIHSLTFQADMTKSMSLLTILSHSPQPHPHLTHIATMLVSSYIRKKRPKEALKVYHWMLRPSSPCEPEKIVYGVLVNGFCQFGLLLEALRILRDMVTVGFVPGAGLTKRVHKSLLREAWVREAVELDRALCSCFDDASGECMKKVINLLDSIIHNWTE